MPLFVAEGATTKEVDEDDEDEDEEQDGSCSEHRTFSCALLFLVSKDERFSLGSCGD